MGSGDIVVGKATNRPDQLTKQGQASDGDGPHPSRPRQQQMCGAMTQQGDGSRERPSRRSLSGWSAIAIPRSGSPADAQRYWMKSPHFCTLLSAAPQGMTGTVEVEFFGEPSISLSE